MRQLTLYASTTRPGEYAIVDRWTGHIVQGPFVDDPDPRRVMDRHALETSTPIELELVSDIRAAVEAIRES